MASYKNLSHRNLSNQNMAIKKHDFIEIEYTAIIEDTSQIFDTTDEETAKSANIYNKNATDTREYHSKPFFCRQAYGYLSVSPV